MADVIDLGGYGAAFRADPYPVYEELRERGPVHRVLLPAPLEYETWLVVGYEEVRAALVDPRLAKQSSKAGRVIEQEEVVASLGRHLLMSDPPEHTRLRSLVSRAFTMRRVEALRPRVQEIVDELLDAMLPAGRADLVASLSYPLPITVICELLGVPNMDRARFREMSNEIVAPTGAEAEEKEIRALGDYLTGLIEDRRRSGPTGDLLGDLIRTSAEDGDRLSMAELRGMAFLLLIAGHETTVNLITNGVWTLLTHPGQLAALRADLSLTDGAVEEMLRYEGPVETATYRFAAEPMEIAGVPVEQGDPVMIALASADHDPSRFRDPDHFDIRRDTRGHLAFGHGVHHCLGAPLARLEAGIAIRSLLERAPGLALDGAPGEWLPGMLIRGMRSLPVRW